MKHGQIEIVLILTSLLAITSFFLLQPLTFSGCITPTDDLYINENTELCLNTYNTPDAGVSGVLIINASNIILDCNGSEIIGDASGIGLYSEGNQNVTIRNCILSNYTSGFYLSPGAGNNNYNFTFINNTAYNTSQYCFFMDHCHNSTFINNTAYNTPYMGAGIAIYESNNTLFVNNTVYQSYWGLYISLAPHSILINNNASNNYLGIDILAPNVTLINNTAQENSLYDVIIQQYCDTSITNVTISGDRPLLFIGDGEQDASNEVYSEIILCNASNSNLQNITIRSSNTKSNNGFFVMGSNNITIDGLNQLKTAMFAIFDSNNLTVNNVTAVNASYMPFALSRVNLMTLNNSLIINNITDDIVGIVSGTLSVLMSGNVTVQNTQILDLTSVKTGAAIVESMSTTLINDTITNANKSLVIVDSNDTTIIGCTFNNNTYGVEVNGTSNNTIFSDFSLYGNTYLNFTQPVNFTNLTLGNSSGAITWDFVNLSSVEFNSSNIILNDEFVSLDASANPDFNTSANISLSATCFNPDDFTIYMKEGFPTTKEEILAGSIYTTNKTCVDSNTLQFNVSSFSGYSYNTSGCTTPSSNLYLNNNTVLCAGTYYLNVSNAEGAITLNASNVTLDCNGATIIGNNTFNGYGIYSFNQTNLVVRNCNISNFSIGIYFESATNGTLENNIIDTNFPTYFHPGPAGIVIRSLNIRASMFVTNNIIHTDYGIGLYLLAENSTVINNTVSSIFGVGAGLEGKSNNIINNSFTGIGDARAYNPNCTSIFENNTGTNGMPILYYSQPVNLSNANTSSIILCNASGSQLINITARGVSLSSTNNSLLYNVTSNGSIWITGFAYNNSVVNSYAYTHTWDPLWISQFSDYNQFINSTGDTHDGRAIQLGSYVNNTKIINSTAISVLYRGISIDDFSDNNIIDNCTALSNSSAVALYLYNSKNNTITNSYGFSNRGYAFHTTPWSRNVLVENNTIINNTLISNTSIVVYLDVNSRNNTFVNNTFISLDKLHTLVYISKTNTINNLFYWNNFTDTSGMYINDTNGTNYYNTTINGQPAGNIWYNILDGSINISGTVESPFAELYYGDVGTNYPYNTTNSLNKLNGVSDYAPLTPYGPIKVTLISPANNSINLPSQNTLFTFKFHLFPPAIANCSLYIRGNVSATNESVDVGVTSHFTSAVLVPGAYDWYINCSANNISTTSETRRLIILSAGTPTVYPSATPSPTPTPTSPINPTIYPSATPSPSPITGNATENATVGPTESASPSPSVQIVQPGAIEIPTLVNNTIQTTQNILYTLTGTTPPASGCGVCDIDAAKGCHCVTLWFLDLPCGYCWIFLIALALVSVVLTLKLTKEKPYVLAAALVPFIFAFSTHCCTGIAVGVIEVLILSFPQLKVLLTPKTTKRKP